MTAWIVLALVVVVCLAYVLARWNAYRRLFSDDHFLEVARAAPGLRGAAVERAADFDRASSGILTQSDPRVLSTSSDLAVVYTVREDREGGAFVHHGSVGVIGGPTAHALGSTFVLFVAQRMGLPLERMRFEIAPSTVHHCEVRLTRAEHETIAGSRMRDVSVGEIDALRREAFEARSQVEWKRMLP